MGSSQDTQPPQPAPQPPPPPDLSPRGGSGGKKAGRKPKRLAVAATGMVASSSSSPSSAATSPPAPSASGSSSPRSSPSSATHPSPSRSSPTPTSPCAASKIQYRAGDDGAEEGFRYGRVGGATAAGAGAREAKKRRRRGDVGADAGERGGLHRGHRRARHPLRLPRRRLARGLLRRRRRRPVTFYCMLLLDLNIGIALWLASCGDGWVDVSKCHMQDGSRYKYRSTFRVLIVGSGADEQCAGYGRHRTKYRLGGWNALDEEMRLDVQRIWKRNMGRDDRCISDYGKEQAQFPFLDENVIKTLLEIPLWDIAKLDEPVGKGDKKILREVARPLGLQEAALQPK